MSETNDSGRRREAALHGKRKMMMCSRVNLPLLSLSLFVRFCAPVCVRSAGNANLSRFLISPTLPLSFPANGNNRRRRNLLLTFHACHLKKQKDICYPHCFLSYTLAFVRSVSCGNEHLFVLFFLFFPLMPACYRYSLFINSKFKSYHLISTNWKFDWDGYHIRVMRV